MKNWTLMSGFVLMALATCLLCFFFPNAGTDREAGLVMWLPEETVEYEGTEIAVSKQEAETLPSDTTYLKMSYKSRYSFDSQSRYWDGLSATLILSGTDRRSLHEPEICLGAQGWEIERAVPVTIDTSGGELEVMNLELGQWLIKEGRYVENERGERVRVRAHYFYWWVSKNGSTAFTDERVMKTILDNFFKNKNSRWGYPSIMVYCDPRLPAEEARALARIKGQDFISKFAPKFQKSLGAIAGGEFEERGDVAPESE